MRLNFIKIFSTFFGFGYFPRLPGTAASLLGLGLYILISNNFFLYLTVTIVTVLLGFLVCAKAEREFGVKDSRRIVIDEVSAILILLGQVPKQTVILLCAFLLFRFFDILKPYPIKKIERLPGSLGIMLDDVVAAFYVLVLMRGFIFIGRLISG
jgi:phosphatidylglycerophosphatase A